MPHEYSVIIPAYNEANSIGRTIQDLLDVAKEHKHFFDIIVVDDGSTDATAQVASQYPVQLVRKVHNIGYGHSIKTGIAIAKHDGIIITDADGTYPVKAIPTLITEFEKGFDMVVGARQGKYYRGQMLKHPARLVFRWLAEFTTGRKIPDVNSGLRIFKKSIVQKYSHTLCAGFSFTTTITLAFMLNFHTVSYHPIDYFKRVGKSKVRYFRDTLQTAQIMVESILYYNPIKMFLLLAMAAGVVGVISVLLLLIVPPVASLLIFFTLESALVLFALGLIVAHIRFADIKRN